MPVYLPALGLLSDVYSDEFLAPIASGQLPRAAIAHFAHQLVFRAGSSNQRAREESANAMLQLARRPSVGCAAIAPWVLRPLSTRDTKSVHATVGRLELLRNVVGEFGGVDANASGLNLREVLAFVLPMCEAASQGARDCAVGIVLDVRAIEPVRTEALIEEIRPSVQPMLKARLAPPEAKGLAALSISGKRLPPIATGSADGDEVTAFRGTPPGTDARARARVTASELGMRGPPVAKKKSAQAKTKNMDAVDDDDLLQEASSLLGDVHDHGNAPSMPRPAATSSPTAALDGMFNQTEEDLIAEIMESTK